MQIIGTWRWLTHTMALMVSRLQNLGAICMMLFYSMRSVSKKIRGAGSSQSKRAQEQVQQDARWGIKGKHWRESKVPVECEKVRMRLSRATKQETLGLPPLCSSRALFPKEMIITNHINELLQYKWILFARTLRWSKFYTISVSQRRSFSPKLDHNQNDEVLQ